MFQDSENSFFANRGHAIDGALTIVVSDRRRIVEGGNVDSDESAIPDGLLGDATGNDLAAE